MGITFGSHPQNGFSEAHIAQFLRTSNSSADELFRLICSWGAANERTLQDPGAPFSCFRRLLAFIRVEELSESAVEQFQRGFSVFRLNHQCITYFNEVMARCLKSMPQTRLLVYGPLKDDRKTAILNSMLLVQGAQPIDIRFPRVHGRAVTCLNGVVFFVGGILSGTVISTVTVVDLLAERVSETTSLRIPRSTAAVAASSDEIFICGGWGGTQCLASCERYNEASASWDPLPPLNQEREAATAVFLLDGENDSFFIGPHLLLAGGWDGKSAMTNVELLPLGIDHTKWTDMAPLLHARCFHGSALFGGRVIVVGGKAAVNGNYLTSVEMFTCSQASCGHGQWTELASIGIPSNIVCVVVHQNVLLAFGSTGKNETHVEEFKDFSYLGIDYDHVTGDRLRRFTWSPLHHRPDAIAMFEGVVVVNIKQPPI